MTEKKIELQHRGALDQHKINCNIGVFELDERNCFFATQAEAKWLMERFPKKFKVVDVRNMTAGLFTQPDVTKIVPPDPNEPKATPIVKEDEDETGFRDTKDQLEREEAERQAELDRRISAPVMNLEVEEEEVSKAAKKTTKKATKKATKE